MAHSSARHDTGVGSIFTEFRTLVDSGVKVLSIDETGFISNRYPSKGYGVRGKRLRVAKVRRKRIKVTSIAAIHDSGMMSDTFEGNANSHSFATFVRRLFSTTRAPSTTHDATRAPSTTHDAASAPSTTHDATSAPMMPLVHP